MREISASKRIILSGLAALTVLVASPAAAGNDQVYIYKIQDDKFSKRMSFSGLHRDVTKFLGTSRSWWFRSWIDKKTLEVTHQLVVVIDYQGDWKFYQEAANDQAESLEFTQIDRSTGSCGGLFGCNLTEQVGVSLTDDYLRERATTGFQIKLSAKSGDALIIDVTPAQIQSQLLTENQVLPPERLWVAPAPATPSLPTAETNGGQREVTQSSAKAGPAQATVLPTLRDLTGPPWGEIAFSEPVTLSAGAPGRPATEWKAAVEKLGWTMSEVDADKNFVTTAPRDIKLGSKDADCGAMFGIPYIIDGRAKTQVILNITHVASEDVLKVGVRGYFHTGYGGQDKTLTCKPKEGLAAALAAKISSVVQTRG